MEPLRGGNIGLPTPPSEVEKIWQKAGSPRTPVEWALRWVWNHPEVTVVLSGMNEEAHIEENLAIADAALPNSLTSSELDLVNEAARKYKEVMKVGCTGCGYCLPCPENVRIPVVFEVYNTMHLFSKEAEGKLHYAVRMSDVFTEGESGFASQCVACGECVKKCPQQIEIPDLMAKIAEELEDDQLEMYVAMIKKAVRQEAP